MTDAPLLYLATFKVRRHDQFGEIDPERITRLVWASDEEQATDIIRTEYGCNGTGDYYAYGINLTPALGEPHNA